MKRLALAATLVLAALLVTGSVTAQPDTLQKETAPFFREFDRALEQAVAKDQYVFLDFYTDW